tara:strand:+ start:7121 stop:7447 length:327 start_codon:yes stop_codon:yes gene_type:complete
MSITITKNAEERICAMMRKTDCTNGFLRIALRSGGCSGYTYDFSIIEKADDSDKVIEFEKVKVCIDKKSYLFLIGMEIDYEDTLLRSGIILNNPNAKRSCGCGESVSF